MTNRVKVIPKIEISDNMARQIISIADHFFSKPENLEKFNEWNAANNNPTNAKSIVNNANI